MTSPQPAGTTGAGASTDHAADVEPATGEDVDTPVTGGVREVIGPLAFGTALLALGAVGIWQSGDINADAGELAGPRLLPTVVTWLLTALAALYLAQVLVAARRVGGGQVAHERLSHVPALAGLVVLLVGYAYLLEPVGYVLSTVVFFVLAARLLGSRQPVRDVVVAVGLAVAIYLGFTELLNVRLPAGVIPL